MKGKSHSCRACSYLVEFQNQIIFSTKNKSARGCLVLHRLLTRITIRITFALTAFEKPCIYFPPVFPISTLQSLGKLSPLCSKLFRGIQPLGISAPHWEKKNCLGPHIKYNATCNEKKTS